MPHVVGLYGFGVAIMDYLIDSMDEEYTSIPDILELYIVTCPQNTTSSIAGQPLQI